MTITQTLSKLKNRYSQSNPQALRNPWILAWLGTVVVFLTVNAVFVTFAITTNPGLVDEDYFEKGRDYEQNISKLIAAQDALQWETKLAVPEKIFVTQPDTYRFSAVDARGIPIMDANVQLTAYRPSDADADFVVPLNQVAPGQYQATINLPLPGIWDLKIQVLNGEEHFEMTRRVSAQR